MLLIPAVDIRGGRCVRLWEGRVEAETVYSDDPAAMARKWVEAGAERLHVVDLDGAFTKGPRNRTVIEEIIRTCPVPIQLGGGIRDMKTIESYLALGVSQVILGTAALKDPNLVREACRQFPGCIMVSLDARDNRIAVEGWTETSDADPLDLVRDYPEWGVKAVIFTDIAKDGTQKGPSLASTRRLARAAGLPVIAAGGIATLEDIQRLSPLAVEGLVGIITGRAVYSGTLCLPEALRWIKEHPVPERYYFH